MRLQFLCVFIIFFSANTSYSDDFVSFPEFQTETFCRNLVSKMLDPNEKSTELNKCMANELLIKIRAKHWWWILPAKEQKYILNTQFSEPKYQTYLMLEKHLASAIGEACLKGKIACQNPKGQ